MKSTVRALHSPPYDEYEKIEISFQTKHRDGMEACSLCIDEEHSSCTCGVIWGNVQFILKDERKNHLRNIRVECMAEYEAKGVEGMGKGGGITRTLWRRVQQNPVGFEDLPGGLYDIPFEFHIPKNAPSSFKISNNKYGQHRVRYYLTASFLQNENDDNRENFGIKSPFAYNPHTSISSCDAFAFSTSKEFVSKLFSKRRFVVAASMQTPAVYIKKDPIRLRFDTKNMKSKRIESISSTLMQVVHISEDGKDLHSQRIRIGKPVSSQHLSNLCRQITLHRHGNRSFLDLQPVLYKYR